MEVVYRHKPPVKADTMTSMTLMVHFSLTYSYHKTFNCPMFGNAEKDSLNEIIEVWPGFTNCKTTNRGTKRDMTNHPAHQTIIHKHTHKNPFMSKNVIQ